MSACWATILTVPSFSIHTAADPVPRTSSHSWSQVNAIPCILPLGSFFSPGGCHFLSQSIAFLPASTHSLRLSLSGNPCSFLYLYNQSIPCPSQPSFFNATRVGSRPSSAATWSKTRVRQKVLGSCSHRSHQAGALLTSAV